MSARPPVFVLVLTAALCSLQCGGGNSATGPDNGNSNNNQPAYAVSSFVTAVRDAIGTTGTQQTGTAPATSGGPASTASGNTGAVSGGSNQVRITAPTPFQTVYVFVGGVTGNVGGFWRLQLAAPTTDASVLVIFGTQIPTSSFDLVFGVGTANGAVGAYGSIPTQRLAAASGDIQVSVSWDAKSDVDLHVVDASGEEVYWDHQTSASGGQLDLDSNAGCAIDSKNSENIRWTRAPGGNYTVRVDYWSSCSVSQTNYVVTVRNGTAAVQTFSGNFSGPGDEGGRGSGQSITAFAHAAPSFALLGEVLGLEPLFQPSARKKATTQSRIDR